MYDFQKGNGPIPKFAFFFFYKNLIFFKSTSDCNNISANYIITAGSV